MVFGSLFTGIGGFDLGFERAGLRCAWQCEVDRRCVGVLERHWPDVEKFGDVRRLHVGAGTVDLICGGFPCQDLSVAGSRAGLAGKRSGLWYEFLRILHEARPQWVVVENVTGLLSSNGGRDLAVILCGLAELGYSAAWRVLDSQYFGVAQRRRRVYIVASHGDGRCAEVLFEQEGCFRDTEEAVAAGGEVASASPHPTEGLDPWQLKCPVFWDGSQVVDTLDCASLVKRQTMPERRRFPFVLDPGWRRVVFASECDEEERCPVCGHYYTDCPCPGPTQDGYEYTVYDGEILARPVGTVTRLRRLTPLECERLQGFPDEWTGGYPDSVRYAMLGNAVTVPVAEWIGRRIVGAGEGE